MWFGGVGGVMVSAYPDWTAQVEKTSWISSLLETRRDSPPSLMINEEEVGWRFLRHSLSGLGEIRVGSEGVGGGGGGGCSIEGEPSFTSFCAPSQTFRSPWQRRRSPQSTTFCARFQTLQKEIRQRKSSLHFFTQTRLTGAWGRKIGSWVVVVVGCGGWGWGLGHL